MDSPSKFSYILCTCVSLRLVRLASPTRLTTLQTMLRACQEKCLTKSTRAGEGAVNYMGQKVTYDLEAIDCENGWEVSSMKQV